MITLIQNGLTVYKNTIDNIDTLLWLYGAFLQLEGYTLIDSCEYEHYKRATYNSAYGIITVAISFATLV